MKTSDYPTTVVDPVIGEVRRHKQEIAESFDFDVMALGRSLQREIGDPRFKTPGGERGGDGQPTTGSESE